MQCVIWARTSSAAVAARVKTRTVTTNPQPTTFSLSPNFLLFWIRLYSSTDVCTRVRTSALILVNKDTVQLQDGEEPNWFSDQHSTVINCAQQHSTVINCDQQHSTAISAQLCTPSHLRARVSLWLRRRQQLHTARSQLNPRLAGTPT